MKHSAKTKSSTRSGKTVRGDIKKATKSARASVKAEKKSRRRVQQSRLTRAVAVVQGEASSYVKQAVLPPAAIVPALRGAKSASVQATKPVSSVPTHKYSLGDVVYYTSPSFGRAAASGVYTIVKLLPSDSDDYQYRIKSNGEAFERVARESQLDKA